MFARLAAIGLALTALAGALPADGCCEESTYYADADGDGFGDPNAALTSCEAPPGYTDNALDCDDRDPAINPRAEESCGDRLDNDCDGVIDEGCGSADMRYCDATGGEWNECGSGCGPFTCDNPEPGDVCPRVCVPQCECPEGEVFESGQGCIPLSACEGGSPEGLCARTGGEWTDCGSGCGPATCENPAPGPNCPDVCVAQCACPADAPYWDGEDGCVSREACR